MFYSDTFVCKGKGLGGKTSSKMKPLNKIKPAPPRSGAFAKRIVKSSRMREVYDKGDLGVVLDHGSGGSRIRFTMCPENEIHKINYNHYLPLFFDGIKEKEEPYRTFAIEGACKLLELGKSKVFHAIPQLIIPIKGKSKNAME